MPVRARKIPAIVGPTACGKTSLALALAARLPLEIVCCDSRKVYRGLDIGSAKPTASERESACFHLLDMVEPSAGFSVQEFVQAAHSAIAGIRERGRLPLLEGGTGLYIEALAEGYDFGQAPPLRVLRRQFNQAWERGSEMLRSRVRSLPGAGAVDLDNPRRVIRLLERVLMSINEAECAALLDALGFTPAQEEVMQARKAASASRPQPLPPLVLMGYRLEVQREALEARIHTRTGQMLANGLVDEVRTILDAGVPPGAQSLSGIGYSEAVSFLQGDLSFQELAELITIHTRQYAKRQDAWNRIRFKHFTLLAFTTPAEQAEALHVIETDIRGEYPEAGSG